jgi:hypothetical protein
LDLDGRDLWRELTGHRAAMDRGEVLAVDGHPSDQVGGVIP